MNFVRVRRLIAPLIDVAPTLALLVLGAGFLAARWVAYFAGPSESAPSRHASGRSSTLRRRRSPAAHLFGGCLGRRDREQSEHQAPRRVRRRRHGTGYAIVNAAAATRRRGLVPRSCGVTLEAVHAGHIVVRRGGHSSASTSSSAPARGACRRAPALRAGDAARTQIVPPPRTVSRLRRRNVRVPARNSGARSPTRRWRCADRSPAGVPAGAAAPQPRRVDCRRGS